MNEPVNVRDALTTLARLGVGVLAYVAAGGAVARALGATENGPIEPLIVAQGAGCAALCAVSLALPPRARLAPRGVVAAPLFYVAFMLAWVPFTVFAYTWLMQALHVDLEAQPHLAYFTNVDLSRWQTVVALATIIVVGPLAEEFAFRGYARDLLRAALGPRAGLMATAVLFGVFHGLPIALPMALVGLLFGWLRERYASLVPGFLAHALHNGIMVGVVLRWPQILDEVYR